VKDVATLTTECKMFINVVRKMLMYVILYFLQNWDLLRILVHGFLSFFEWFFTNLVLPFTSKQ